MTKLQFMESTVPVLRNRSKKLFLSQELSALSMVDKKGKRKSTIGYYYLTSLGSLN